MQPTRPGLGHGSQPPRLRVRDRSGLARVSAEPAEPHRTSRVETGSAAAFPAASGQVPLGLDQPYWIEDRHFTIDSHVRDRCCLRRGDHELAEQAARLHEKPLDRARPLWEMHLIHGLAAGKQAVYIRSITPPSTGCRHQSAWCVVGPHRGLSRCRPCLRGDGRRANPDELLARSVASAARQPIRLTRLSVDLLRLACSGQ